MILGNNFVKPSDAFSILVANTSERIANNKYVYDITLIE